MEQKDRDVIMREFRSGSSRVLITTDLLVGTTLMCVHMHSACVWSMEYGMKCVIGYGGQKSGTCVSVHMYTCGMS